MSDPHPDADGPARLHCTIFIVCPLLLDREEDSKFKQSDAAQKRREALQQAESRKREEAIKARELAKQEMIARR